MILTQNSPCKNASKSTRLHLILHAGDCGCARVMWMSACQVIDVLYIAYGSGGSWVVSMFEHLSLEVCTCWRAHVNLNVCFRLHWCSTVQHDKVSDKKRESSQCEHSELSVDTWLCYRGQSLKNRNVQTCYSCKSCHVIIQSLICSCASKSSTHSFARDSLKTFTGREMHMSPQVCFTIMAMKVITGKWGYLWLSTVSCSGEYISSGSLLSR